MRTCEDMTMFMSLYIDNELSGKELSYFENHLRQCDSCKRELESLRGMLLQIKDLEEVPLPPNFHQEVMSKISKKPKINYSRYAMAASMFLIFASIVIFFSNDLEDFNADYQQQVEFMVQPRGNLMIGDDTFEVGSISSDVEIFALEEPNMNLENRYYILENDVVSYKLMLEVENIDDAFNVINNLPGETWVRDIADAFSIIGILSEDIWGNIEGDYSDWMFLQKEIYINDYEQTRSAIESLGFIVAEEVIDAEAFKIGGPENDFNFVGIEYVKSGESIVASEYTLHLSLESLVHLNITLVSNN